MRISGLKGLLQSLCCFLGYAVIYYATREVSATNWQLTAGIRFTAFLFLPSRLWPAIFAGDMLGATAYRWDGIGWGYGWEWLTVGLIGTPLASLIPAAVLRQLTFKTWRLGLNRKVVALLHAAGFASLSNAAVGIVAMHLIHPTHGGPHLTLGPRYFLTVFLLGNFLGILLVAPAVMTWRLLRTHRQTIAASEVQRQAAGFWRVVGWTAAILIVLLILNRTTDADEVRMVTGILMFAPAIVLAYRQSWVGAVAATILANIAIELTNRGDPNINPAITVFDVQVIMAFACTALLLFGARMTEDRVRQSIIDREHKKTLLVARNNLMWGESRIRHTAGLVERAFSTLQRFVDHAALQLQPETSPNAIATLRWASNGLLSNEVRRSASAMHVSELEAIGFKGALVAGAISQAMQDACIDFPVRVSSGIGQVSEDTQVHLYRATHDLVMLMASEFNPSKISVRIKLANHRTRIALVVKAWPGHGDAPALPPCYTELDQLQALAHSYRGVFHDRRRRRRPALSLLLHVY